METHSTLHHSYPTLLFNQQDTRVLILPYPQHFLYYHSDAPHCNFDVHFSDGFWCWTSYHVICISSLEKHLNSFLRDYFRDWVSGVLYEFWLLVSYQWRSAIFFSLTLWAAAFDSMANDTQMFLLLQKYIFSIFYLCAFGKKNYCQIKLHKSLFLLLHF